MLRLPVVDWMLHLTPPRATGAKFKRRTFTFGFGTGNERAEVRLKEDTNTVVVWRKESEGNQNTSWHEIDLLDVKTIEPKGELVFPTDEVCFIFFCFVCGAEKHPSSTNVRAS